MSERVDKAWAQKGLGDYSSEAILGTLRHYGVDVDEAGYRALAASASPIRIAMQWMGKWKGTGQFARFPAAAAEVLWRRYFPDRATPGEFLEAISGLLVFLERVLGGKTVDAELDAAFSRTE